MTSDDTRRLPILTPEQRRRDARPRVRRLPDAAGRDRRGGRDGAGDRLPAHRHRRRVRQRARGRRGASAAPGSTASEIFVETKVWITDYGYDATLHAFDKSAGKLGVEQIDLLILHQALPGEFDLTIDAYRALETLLADGKVRAIGVSNFMPDHLTRLLDETAVVPAVNQIEVHPYFRQSELLAVERRARHPHPGVVADRRHHLLPRRLARQHARGPGDRRDRRRARQDPGAGDAALAPAAGPSGDPEVGHARRGSPRTSTSSTSSSPPTSSPPSTLSTPASAAAPSRRQITLETFGREIPEALRSAAHADRSPHADDQEPARAVHR